MAGMFGRIARFARSPQGRQLADRAKRMAKDPETRRKIEQFRRRRGGGRPPGA